MKTADKNQTLFVILDANSIMHRSFHALPPLKTREGELVNAVYGFSSILMTILHQENPQYIATAFDTAAPTFRHEVYKEYKAGRVKAPDEFYAQIPRIEEIVRTMNIPILRQDGVEADDIIGTIVTTNEKQHPELHNKIVTSDMDAMQLVTDKTCVSNLHKGYKATECFYPNDVFTKYGIRPDQVVDYKAIQGDNSDNIPGVKGIGKVGAIQLLQEFDSLDGIYANLEKVKGKKQELLRDQKEDAYFSQQLATIKCDVDIDYQLKACQAHDFDMEKIEKLFESMQFYSLIRRIRDWRKSNGISSEDLQDVFQTEPKKKAKKASEDQTSMF
ncbi:MAG: 5'-3' exonuclease H3TH domain-containing protein [Candidatus Altimarinota bacterium]